jgi:hypothetical protein
MQRLFTIACLLLISMTSAFADESLPSRDLALPFAVVTGREPESFDLIDLREEQRLERVARLAKRTDTEPHTFFIVKQHLGVAGGFDNGIARGGLGFYITVAEWERWNFGVPSPEIGMGRYQVFDRASQRALMKDQVTFLVSLMSAHYRLGYIRAWGVHAYINLEQVYDMKTNQAGSQFGLSFSSK